MPGLPPPPPPPQDDIFAQSAVDIELPGGIAFVSGVLIPDCYYSVWAVSTPDQDNPRNWGLVIMPILRIKDSVNLDAGVGLEWRLSFRKLRSTASEVPIGWSSSDPTGWMISGTGVRNNLTAEVTAINSVANTIDIKYGITPLAPLDAGAFILLEPPSGVLEIDGEIVHGSTMLFSFYVTSSGKIYRTYRDSSGYVALPARMTSTTFDVPVISEDFYSDAYKIDLRSGIDSLGNQVLEPFLPPGCSKVTLDINAVLDSPGDPVDLNVFISGDDGLPGVKTVVHTSKYSYHCVLDVPLGVLCFNKSADSAMSVNLVIYGYEDKMP